MDWVKYDYSFLAGPNQWIKEPRVDVILFREGVASLPQSAMIDSGAYVTMVSADLMGLFKVEQNQCKKMLVGGIFGAPIESFIHDMSLKVDGFEDSFKIPVLFVPGLKINMLLGQAGFFENFKVRFENDQNTFYLSRVSKNEKTTPQNTAHALLGKAISLPLQHGKRVKSAENMPKRGRPRQSKDVS